MSAEASVPGSPTVPRVTLNPSIDLEPSPPVSNGSSPRKSPSPQERKVSPAPSLEIKEEEKGKPSPSVERKVSPSPSLHINDEPSPLERQVSPAPSPRIKDDRSPQPEPPSPVVSEAGEAPAPVRRRRKVAEDNLGQVSRPARRSRVEDNISQVTVRE